MGPVSTCQSLHPAVAPYLWASAPEGFSQNRVHSSGMPPSPSTHTYMVMELLIVYKSWRACVLSCDICFGFPLHHIFRWLWKSCPLLKPRSFTIQIVIKERIKQMEKVLSALGSGWKYYHLAIRGSSGIIRACTLEPGSRLDFLVFHHDPR